MNKIIIFITLLLFSVSKIFSQEKLNNSNTLSTSNFNYDYIESRLGMIPITFGLGISKSIHPNAYAIARIDTKLKKNHDLAMGAGFHTPLNNWLDFFGEMLFHIRDRSDFPSTRTGMEANISARQWFSPQLEIGAKLGYISIIDDQNGALASIYARFHSTELFSLGIEAIINDMYSKQIMMTSRFKF
ncbi:hypothetical protein CF66_2422 [Candidatus Photodesmus katoptron]|nr:hypothetical protein [Candidatus Photodesmus katoptron]KEY90711.1 hypothetical protein CF66_2422 [Candidatus Photodesmus katoptron]